MSTLMAELVYVTVQASRINTAEKGLTISGKNKLIGKKQKWLKGCKSRSHNDCEIAITVQKCSSRGK
jgi:hypothetical protein